MINFAGTNQYAASVAAIPIEADPAAIPDNPIAIAMATVDNGDMIIKLNTIEINILINTGCNSVKLLTMLPIPVVINLTYGKKYADCSC